ncbi:MAG: hypothetical protein MZV63_05080 [Marinilabiliales bacterium]|nr:hypothetical protein [Marinilabiliales bacterium]
MTPLLPVLILEKGTGIGLKLVHELVTISKGTISPWRANRERYMLHGKPAR